MFGNKGGERQYQETAVTKRGCFLIQREKSTQNRKSTTTTIPLPLFFSLCVFFETVPVSCCVTRDVQGRTSPCSEHYTARGQSAIVFPQSGRVAPPFSLAFFYRPLSVRKAGPGKLFVFVARCGGHTAPASMSSYHRLSVGCLCTCVVHAYIVKSAGEELLLSTVCPFASLHRTVDSVFFLSCVEKGAGNFGIQANSQTSRAEYLHWCPRIARSPCRRGFTGWSVT